MPPFLIRKPVMNDVSDMLNAAINAANMMNTRQYVPTPALLKVLHHPDAPGDNDLVYAEVELLPESTSREDALYRAVEMSANDPTVWETFVVSLVPVDGVEGKALIDANDAREQQKS